MKKVTFEEEVRERLFALRDAAYCEMQKKIIPSVAPERIIGVRTPALRGLAKELADREEMAGYLAALPHRYFDENQLHAFVISREKDYERAVAAVDAFLPCVDNWATCDQMSPKAFRKHRAELLTAIDRWLASDRTFTVRFGVDMLLEHYLDEDFDPSHLARVASLKEGEYYVDMARAWYFATALAKQYDAALPYIEQRRLDPWTHNKSIQKATESYRVTDEAKQYLRTLKVKLPRTKNEKGEK